MVLAGELRLIRLHLGTLACPEDEQARVNREVDLLQQAEVAAQRGNAEGVRKVLRQVGGATLSSARELGVDVAAAAITRQMGLS